MLEPFGRSIILPLTMYIEGKKCIGIAVLTVLQVSAGRTLGELAEM